MGFFDLFGVGKRKSDFLASGIVSPWAEPGGLQTIVWSDILGAEAAALLPLTRADAMRIPAVGRGRNLLVSTITKFPLVALGKDGILPDDQQPSFLYRSDTSMSPYERMVWTLDDGIFYGSALWRDVVRGSNNQILSADYCCWDEWTITDGKILVDEKPVDESEIILFNFPFDGLLNVAARTLRGAVDLEKSWTGRVRNPIPITVIRSTDDVALNQPEVNDLLSQWKTARRSEDGALGYLPPNLVMETYGEVDPALFIEGRNAVSSDIARHLNIPVAMLDSTVGVDSLTYTTTAGNRNRFLDESVPFWTDAIEARLSMDDIVPRGQRIRFDKTEAYAQTPNPTDAPEQD